MKIREALNPSDDPARHMTRFMLAFAIAAIGVTLGFIAAAIPSVVLGIAGFAIAAVGIVGGFIAIILGWVSFPREVIGELRSFRERQSRTWKRPDWKP